MKKTPQQTNRGRKRRFRSQGLSGGPKVFGGTLYQCFREMEKFRKIEERYIALGRTLRVLMRVEVG